MLELKIGKETLDLYAKTKAKFNYQNPAFGQKGGYSLPFAIPKTARNCLLTGFVDRLDSVTTQKVHDASLWLGGIPFDYGIINMKSSSDKSIEIYFLKEETNFQSQLALLKIRELIPDVNIGTASYTLLYEAPQAGPSVMITINDIVFEHIRDIVNDTPSIIAADLESQINAVYPNTATTNGSFITLNSDENHHIVTSGLTFDAANSTTYEASVLGIWTTYFNNLTNSDFVFPTTRNQAAESFINEINSYLLNQYQFINQEFSDIGNPEYYYSIAPYFLFTSILEAIETELSVNFTGSFLNSGLVQGLILLHQKNIDEHIKKTLGNDYVTAPALSFTPGNFLADVDGEQFLKGFLDFFCAYIQFDTINKEIEIKQRKNLLNTIVEDWTGKATAAYKNIPSSGNGYRINLLKDKNDDYAPVSSYGNGERNYDIDVAITKQFKNSKYDNLISINQDIKTEIILKFGQWIGLSGNDYPKATSFSINDVAGYWEDWISFLSSAKQTNKDFVLNINDLLKLRTFSAPLRLINTEDGSTIGLVSEFSFEADSNGISFTDVELKTLKEISDSMTYYVEWAVLTNIVPRNNNTGIEKNTGGNAWNSKALSKNKLGSDGWAEMTINSLDKSRFFTLSEYNTNTSSGDLNYSVLIRFNNIIRIQENGTIIGDYGTVSVGDIFRIERTGTVITFKKNGVVLATSSIASVNDLYVDIRMNHQVGSIDEIICSFV